MTRHPLRPLQQRRQPQRCLRRQGSPLLARTAFAAGLVLLSVAARADDTTGLKMAPMGDHGPPTLFAGGARCQVLAARPGNRYVIQANMQVATRVAFPGPIEIFENSLPKLWDVSTYDNSLWARPNTATPEGARTGVSVRLKNGAHYDFIFQANPLQTSRSCVIIPTTARRASRSGPTMADVAATEAQQEAQQAAFNDAVENIRRQAEHQANDAIRAFTYSMNTDYDWKPATKLSAGMLGLVSAVFDDGRFTYVRIRTTGFGLPSLSARDGNTDLVVQYTYDDLTGVYTVLGLYDDLRLAVGSNIIDIRRKG